MITPILIAHIHWATYLFFAVLNASFLPVIYFYYPETKQRSLEEIDIIFARGFVGGVGGGVRRVGEGGIGEGSGVEVQEGGLARRWKGGDAYVRAARELRFLSDEEVEEEQRRYGLVVEGGGNNALEADGSEVVVAKEV